MLGGLRVSVGIRTVEQNEWRLKKAMNLVKLLALSPGHALQREQLTDLLWPDLGPREAANNLRGALYAARRALATDSAKSQNYLVSYQGRIHLCPERDLWVDVEVFEEAALAVRRSGEPSAYEAALDLYTGELLPEDRYERWAEDPRRRLREIYLSLLVGLAGSHEKRGDYGSAIEILQRTVVEEPVLEEGHVGLMRAHALSGHKGEALAQYRRLKEIFFRELGTEPSAATRAVVEEISSGRFPPTSRPPHPRRG